jgi:hypothetical protein
MIAGTTTPEESIEPNNNSRPVSVYKTKFNKGRIFHLLLSWYAILPNRRDSFPFTLRPPVDLELSSPARMDAVGRNSRCSLPEPARSATTAYSNYILAPLTSIRHQVSRIQLAARRKALSVAAGRCGKLTGNGRLLNCKFGPFGYPLRLEYIFRSHFQPVFARLERS